MFNFPEVCQVAVFEPRICLTDLPAEKRRIVWNWLKDKDPALALLLEDVRKFKELGLPVEKIYISPTQLPNDLVNDLEDYLCTEP